MTTRRGAWVSRGTERAARPNDYSVVWQRVARLAAVVLPPSVVVALFFYFGWTYTEALYSEMGIDADGLDFATQDYVLRSLNVLIEPIPVVVASILAATLLGVSVLLALGRLRRTSTRRARFAGYAIEVAILLGGVALLVWSSQLPTPPYSAPAALAVAGLAALAFGVYLLAAGPQYTRSQSPLNRAVRSHSFAALVTATLLAALATHQVFEFVRLYALDRADRQIQVIADQPWQFAMARIVSKSDLALNHAKGVVRYRTANGDSVHYIYDCFRLFLHDNGRYLLWPAAQSPRQGMIMLAEAPEIRVESWRGSRSECSQRQ